MEVSRTTTIKKIYHNLCTIHKECIWKVSEDLKSISHKDGIQKDFTPSMISLLRTIPPQKRTWQRVMCIPFWYRKKAREYNRWNNENENVSFDVNKYDSDNSSSKNSQHQFYWILLNNKINHFFHLSSFSKLHNFIFLNFLFFSGKN